MGQFRASSSSSSSIVEAASRRTKDQSWRKDRAAEKNVSVVFLVALAEGDQRVGPVGVISTGYSGAECEYRTQTPYHPPIGAAQAADVPPLSIQYDHYRGNDTAA